MGKSRHLIISTVMPVCLLCISLSLVVCTILVMTMRARQTRNYISTRIIIPTVYLLLPSLSLFVFLPLRSDVCPRTLWLRGPGRWGTLLFRGSGDPPVEPGHSDGRRLLGGGAKRTGGRLPLCAGRGFHWEWGDQWRRDRWCTGMLMQSQTPLWQKTARQI